MKIYNIFKLGFLYIAGMFKKISGRCHYYVYVTFHGIQFPREYMYGIIDVSLVPLGHIRMWHVRLSWDYRVTCSTESVAHD